MSAKERSTAREERPAEHPYDDQIGATEDSGFFSQAEPVEHDLLVRLAVAIEPYLEEVVLCGGWVPYLYWECVEDPERDPPLRTQDADFAVPRRLPVTGGRSLEDGLRDLGARPLVVGTGRGVVKFEIDHEDATVPIEFLTPLVGDGTERHVEVQEGLRVEPLRYLDLLLERTERIRIQGNLDGEHLQLAVRVPAPGAFVAQKVLTADRRRTREKKGKDLEYVRDLLTNYPELRPKITDDLGWLRGRHAPWLDNLRNELRRLFAQSKRRGPRLMLPVVYPEGLPEALSAETALDELGRPFLELLDLVDSIIDGH